MKYLKTYNEELTFKGVKDFFTKSQKQHIKEIKDKSKGEEVTKWLHEIKNDTIESVSELPKSTSSKYYFNLELKKDKINFTDNEIELKSIIDKYIISVVFDTNNLTMKSEIDLKINPSKRNFGKVINHGGAFTENNERYAYRINSNNIQINQISSVFSLGFSDTKKIESKKDLEEYIDTPINYLTNILNGLVKQIKIWKNSNDEENKRRNDFKEKVELFKSKHEEIEDCLFGLIDSSESYETRVGNNGCLYYTFKLKGIEVDKEEYTRRNVNHHVFDQAKLNLTDELITLFNSLKSIKARSERIFPEVKIKTYFKENELTIIFYIEESIQKKVGQGEYQMRPAPGI